MDDNYFKREKLTAPWKWRRHVQDAEIAAAETRKYQKGIYVEKQVDRSGDTHYTARWTGKKYRVDIDLPDYDSKGYSESLGYNVESAYVPYYDSEIYETAALIAAEKQYGPLMMEEKQDKYLARIKRLDQIEEWKKEKEEYLKRKAVALPMKYFRSSDAPLLVDLPKILSHATIYEADENEWKKYLRPQWKVHVFSRKPLNGVYGWRAEVYTQIDGLNYRLITDFDSKGISTINIEIAIEYGTDTLMVDEEQMKAGQPLFVWTASAFSKICSYIAEHSAEFRFSTSTGGHNLLTLMEEEVLHPKVKTDSLIPDIVMKPRILLGRDANSLTFRVGYEGGKTVILKSYEDFYLCAKNHCAFSASKTIVLDFFSHTFTPESEDYYRLFSSQIASAADMNEVFYRRYGYDGMSISHALDFDGALLDRFYEISEGRKVDMTVQVDHGKEEFEILVAHQDISVQMIINEVQGANGPAGISVAVDIPARLSGAMYTYSLNLKQLSRMSDQENEVLRPFDSSYSGGSYGFTVAREDLRSFYTRVLPRFDKSPYFEVVDNTSEAIRTILPPEAEFTFKMDLDQDMLICQASVAYGGKDNVLGIKPGVSENSDKTLETAVIMMLKEVFDSYDRYHNVYFAEVDDQHLYDFLMHDVARMEAYGTVVGTDAFNKLHVRPAPKMALGVSVSQTAGLMDLKLTSPDADPEELAAILNSYHQHKKYHRLKSGDFVDLEDTSSIEDMEEVFSQLDLNDLEAIRDKVSAPLYRALYVDKLLEKHDDIAARRDSHIRSLIKNFKDIKDSDIEVPAETADILRPYQEYGFKWLAVLEKTGFGGILADEMGLGKTLQMITLFLYNKENGEEKSALVVCPASLVYNWEEEIHRFAPSLKAQVIAGLPAKRKEALDTRADVYITSYDLLKRDLKLYEGRAFSVCVIDEAQYIKNATAAQAKAVKVIQADHRFALTGTPIENRLSELWSIFDFLMPGLLYNNKTFMKKFETPIVKNQDDNAAKKLRGFTGPFILRRKKEEVLKDLPEKLEETRYARMEGEQQKLYDAEVAHMKKMLTIGMKNTDPSEAGKEKIRILAELTRIRQICCDPSLAFDAYKGESAKREACMNLIQAAMEEGHRMLVFSQFTSMLALLEEDLKAAGISYYKIIGETPKEKRMEMVKAFNHNDVPVFLISLKAGGTGLNLTGADVVIHYDPWWNIAAQNQATDRAHRIGQTKKVTVYRLIMKDTIEEKIMNLQNVKQDLANAIIEGDHTSLTQMSPEELMALLD